MSARAQSPPLARPASVPAARPGPLPAGCACSTRRAALLVAAGLVLARPTAAPAADRQAAALADLVAREQDAAFAYRAHDEPWLVRIGGQEAEHGLALRSQLGALTRPAPEPPRDASELGAEAARLAAAGDSRLRREAAIALERSLLDAYRAAIATLAEAGVRRTAATVMASHGQHLTVLYEGSARDPIEASR